MWDIWGSVGLRRMERVILQQSTTGTMVYLSAMLRRAFWAGLGEGIVKAVEDVGQFIVGNMVQTS